MSAGIDVIPAKAVDLRRCTGCGRIFGRSRWMVRRGTERCQHCSQAAVGRTAEEMRALGARGHEAQRARRLAALLPRLEQLSKVECYQLGRTDEYNRLRAQAKRDAAVSA